MGMSSDIEDLRATAVIRRGKIRDTGGEKKKRLESKDTEVQKSFPTNPFSVM